MDGLGHPYVHVAVKTSECAYVLLRKFVVQCTPTVVELKTELE